MNKTPFNDPRENDVTWATACPSCRCQCSIIVVHYPHGPDEVKRCPVCGDCDIEIQRYGEKKIVE